MRTSHLCSPRPRISQRDSDDISQADGKKNPQTSPSRYFIPTLSWRDTRGYSYRQHLVSSPQSCFMHRGGGGARNNYKCEYHVSN